MDRVIGVVECANLHGLEQHEGLPVVYTVLLDAQGSWRFTLLLRSDRPAMEVIADMRRTLAQVDPSVPLLETGVLQDALDDMIFARRAVAVVMRSFSLMRWCWPSSPPTACWPTR
jgi:hypothetical protein